MEDQKQCSLTAPCFYSAPAIREQCEGFYRLSGFEWFLLMLKNEIIYGFYDVIKQYSILQRLN